jgi:hypothetical protein
LVCFTFQWSVFTFRWSLLLSGGQIQTMLTQLVLGGSSWCIYKLWPVSSNWAAEREPSCGSPSSANSGRCMSVQTAHIVIHHLSKVFVTINGL